MAIKWTAKQDEEIIDRILSGESIVDILDSIGISSQSFYRRKAKDEEFGIIIARAQSDAQDAWVDRAEKLAMSATAENWQLTQFQCRNIQWTAGKRKAKSYGDKVEQFISGPGGGPMQAAISVEFVKVDGPAKD